MQSHFFSKMVLSEFGYFFPSSCWIVAFFRILRDENQIVYLTIAMYALFFFCCCIYLDCQICSVWAAPAINKVNTMEWRRWRWRERTHTKQAKFKTKLIFCPNLCERSMHQKRTHIHTSALIYHWRYLVCVHVFFFFILVNFRCIIMASIPSCCWCSFKIGDLKNT